MALQSTAACRRASSRAWIPRRRRPTLAIANHSTPRPNRRRRGQPRPVARVLDHEADHGRPDDDADVPGARHGADRQGALRGGRTIDDQRDQLVKERAAAAEAEGGEQQRRGARRQRQARVAGGITAMAGVSTRTRPTRWRGRERDAEHDERDQ